MLLTFLLFTAVFLGNRGTSCDMPCCFRIPSDLMRTVFKVAAQTDEGWGKLLDMYKHSINDPEKHKTLEALASTQDVRKIIW